MMATAQSLPWTDPLDMAAAIAEPNWVLLYSGASPGRMSYLAHDLAERVESNDFDCLAAKLSAGRPALDNAWFGALGYGLKDSLETLPKDAPGWLTFPTLCMMRFHTIYAFDHEKKAVTRWADKDSNILTPRATAHDAPRISGLHSNMSRAEYLEKAAHVIESIRGGDLYQANLTRKFMGNFDYSPDGFSIFRSLCAISPAAYSAYFCMDDKHIISSSPELFLKISANGEVITRPIKGTAPRFADSESDSKSRAALASSEKDRAENLMIVDLMRNDLSKTCLPGSIVTGSLFDITTHPTIHHMSSTVTGEKSPDVRTLDVVKHCFPPGSMTGAPKIKAMKLCSELETQARGIYSGAIGWFGGDGSAELSVVIRTLLIQGKKFEFQVGGGIVADSTPQAELQELLTKATAIVKALGIAPEDLQNL